MTSWKGKQKGRDSGQNHRCPLFFKTSGHSIELTARSSMMELTYQGFPGCPEDLKDTRVFQVGKHLILDVDLCIVGRAETARVKVALIPDHKWRERLKWANSRFYHATTSEFGAWHVCFDFFQGVSWVFSALNKREKQLLMTYSHTSEGPPKSYTQPWLAASLFAHRFGVQWTLAMRK